MIRNLVSWFLANRIHFQCQLDVIRSPLHRIQISRLLKNTFNILVLRQFIVLQNDSLCIRGKGRIGLAQGEIVLDNNVIAAFRVYFDVVNGADRQRVKTGSADLYKGKGKNKCLIMRRISVRDRGGIYDHSELFEWISTTVSSRKTSRIDQRFFLFP